jgi:hypothetical protein
MTELAWETEHDPMSMLEHLFPFRGENSALPPTRKARLYFAACARRVWDRLPWCCRELVSAAERAVDRARRDRPPDWASVHEAAETLVGTCGCEPEVVAEVLAELDLRIEELQVGPGGHMLRSPEPYLLELPKPWDGLALLVYALFAGDTSWFRRVPAELHSADLIRDVFGYPFAPYTQLLFRPAWRTSTAVELARQMYDSRDFGLMPILGDALQDAGCGDPAVLAHCQDADHPHVRGCWVVDLVLGKK